MPLYNQWKGNGATWGIWKVTESPEELQTMLTETSVDFAELEHYKSEGRRLEYLAARVLLKKLTGKEQKIAHFPTGKPYLPETNLHISVSHTKGYLAIGLHPTREVGIDIEQVSERVRKVTSRFIRVDELKGVASHASAFQLYEYLLVWSAKESMFKVLNSSEVDFLEHLHVADFSLKTSGVFVGHEYRTPLKRTFAIYYKAQSDFVLTYLIA